MSKSSIRRALALALLCLWGAAAVWAESHQLRISVTDKALREPLIRAVCQLAETGAAAVTDVQGVALLKNVPRGRYTLVVRYLGFEPVETQILVNRDLTLNYQLVETSLALKQVNVVARQRVSGASTSSVIGRQAIDHLQATSLADVMQLIPGQLVGNGDLIGQTNLQLRTLSNNHTSAFGSSIVMDGVPLSNNGALTQGAFSGTAFTGTDLRQIASDDIDEVEIIRGIPSAEYGDLTSGLVVVRSKVGVTPYQVKMKLTPALQNYSVSKGFKAGNAGVFNASLDYAKAWSDPRSKTRSYGRYTASTGWGFDPTRRWHTDTKLRFSYTKDWTGKDPDAVADGTYTRNRSTGFSLTHNGRFSANHRLLRTLSYTAGLTITDTRDEASSYVSNSTGLLPILTARETGYYQVPWMTTSYLATGRTESRPGAIFLKANDAFFWRTGPVRQNFKVGVEYHYDWNNGAGYYNVDETRPYRPNADGRPRAFSEVPGLHQFSAFAEDAATWSINKVQHLRVNFGLRFTSLQPFSSLATTALSPRLNASLSLTRWLSLRGGVGLNSKTPGLAHLYPDKKYADRVAVNYMPQDDPAAQLLVYQTQVYDVKRSAHLRNATTTKVEAGVDVKLPWGGALNLIAYRDRTPNGFGAATEYFTYYSDVFTAAQGLNITPGAATTIDYANPARHDLVFMTTGLVGNTNTSVNRGLEVDFDFGRLKPLHTTFYLSGAFQESQTWSTDLNSTSVRTALLPTDYSNYGLTPFKVVYPSGLDRSTNRRYLTTLRVVTHIPALKMVASLTGQVIWHEWRYSYTADKDPIGWIDANLRSHSIDASMMEGYLGMDGQYYAIQPIGQSSVKVSDLRTTYTDSSPVKNPVTWNLSARLTKELGKLGGLSLYVNNCLYYEPYLRSNNTLTLTQRNTSSFNFGAELYLNL